jgi:hypothetical protein
MNYTVYISNIEDGGKISLKLSLFFQTEFMLKKNLETTLINDSKVKNLPDGIYQAIVCDDAKLDPSDVITTNNLGNKEGYVITKDLTLENHIITIK